MKKILSLGVACFLGLSATAQETATKQYGFWDNWFLQLQGGVNYTKAENATKANFFDMLTPKVQFGVGKFFSPYVGTRLSVGGWQSKHYQYLPSARGLRSRHIRQNYVESNLDGLFNLTNIFAPRKEYGGFNLYLIAGVNYTHRVKNSDLRVGTNDFFSPRAGLLADWKLSDAVSLNVEVAGNLLPNQFNGLSSGSKYDYNTNALIGFTYRFPKRGFQKVSVGEIDHAELDRLHAEIYNRNREIYRQKNQIANLNTTVSNLKNQLAQKPQEVVSTEVVVDNETVLNAVVVFKLGSAQLEDNQTINIYNAAKYLRENPSVNVIVTGYADKATGTAEINQKISEKRAKVVADILTNRYGISPARITTQASGDKQQPFEINEWNRVVVFSVK